MANLSNINGKFVVEQTTGYVGVGTTDPNFLIEAAGANSEIALNSTSASIYRLRSTSSDSFIITKNGVGDRLVIDGSGNVEIGADYTNAKLSVGGNLAILNTKQINLTGTLDSDSLWYGMRYNNNEVQIYTYYPSDRSITFNTVSGGTGITTQLMKIEAGGNVGIGITDPAAKLDVESNHSQLRLTDSDDSKYVLYSYSGGKLIVRNNSTNTTVNQFTLTEAGKFGIGTISPATKLDVTGTDNGDTVRVANTGTYGGTISFNQGAGHTNIGYVGSLRAFEGNGSGDNGIGLYSRDRISFYTSSTTPDLTIADNGNVGIGVTSNIQGALHVAGRVNTNRIVSSNIILGNIRSNLTTTSYLLLVDLNITAGFSLAGKLNAASYTTWNVSDIYVRKNYNSATGVASITGISKSGSNLSIVDISHASGRFIAIKLTGDPEIDVMWTGYRLNALFGSDGIITTLTSGVTENSVYASY